MNETRKASFGFTKLIVDDEEAQAEYYHQVYGLNKLLRVQNDDSGAGGPIREVIMGPGDTMSAESLVMLKIVDRPAPRDQEAILGFITEDLDALSVRIAAHGGKLLDEIKSMPEHGIRVVFSTDPEGRMSENVELTAR
jgi:uncharacterized glyoxalase superfamily protein PhnB